MKRFSLLVLVPALAGAGQCGGGSADLVDAGPRPDADPAAPDSGPPFTGDPAADGPFQVYEQGVTIPGPLGNITATVYAPSHDGATVATADGPFPLVVVMHGFTASHPVYAPFSRHFATWGFLAVGIDFTDDGDHEDDAREAMAAIDWATAPGTLVGAAVDPTRIATAGHSLGGKIAFFAAVLDPRVRVVIGWDPVDSGGPPCFIDPNACQQWSIAPNSYAGDTGMMDGLHVATLIFGAPVGAFNPEEHHAKRFWEGTTSPGLFVLFPSGDHLRWPSGDPEQRVTKRTQVAWLLQYFNGMSDLEPYFEGAVMQADVLTGKVAVVAK